MRKSNLFKIFLIVLQPNLNNTTSKWSYTRIIPFRSKSLRCLIKLLLSIACNRMSEIGPMLNFSSALKYKIILHLGVKSTQNKKSFGISCWKGENGGSETKKTLHVASKALDLYVDATVEYYRYRGFQF